MSSFTVNCNGEDYELLMVILTCIVEIEDITAKIYKIIAKHFPNYIASILLHIARESQNHYDTLKSLKELLECEEYSNIVCSYEGVLLLRNKLEEVMRAEARGRLRNEELIKLFDYLVEVEQFASEEYYVMIIMPLLIERLYEIGIPVSYANIWKWILEEISQEEKYHAKIAESIREYLVTHSD